MAQKQLVVLRRRVLGDGAALALVRVEVNGQVLNIAADSPISFSAGPGPTTLTVTLIVSDLEIIDDEPVLP